jgi:membrane-associated phospholipid phosphatase
MSQPMAVDDARAAWRALAITIVATLAAMQVDTWVYQDIHNPRVYEQDWGRLLRVMGFLGTWLALAIAIRLVEGPDAATRPRARRRANLLFWTAALGGAGAELLKLLLRRERPAVHDGLYGFRPFDERTWSTSGLAFPSSHAMVAFAGAAMLARLYPRARWVGYTLAIGCAITRVLARAHFVSDVVLGAGLGWLVAWGVSRRWPPGSDPAPAVTPSGPAR